MNFKSLLLLVSSWSIAFCLHAQGTGTFIDSRDNHQYQWVKIGEQIWMAENLAYLPAVSPPSAGSNNDIHFYVPGYEGSSVSEAKNSDNYTKYGVLYNWPAALNGVSSGVTVQGICPNGWHLSSDEEWKTLERYLGMDVIDVERAEWRSSGDVGMKLKSTSGWPENGNGSNFSGFNALPGGYRNPDGGFFFLLGTHAHFWSFQEIGSSGVVYRDLGSIQDGVYRSGAGHSFGFAVRCLKNVSPRITDSLALVALYNKCDGPNWVMQTNWLTGNLSTWAGVTIENDRVVELNLGAYNTSSHGLKGTIPEELVNLTEVRVINFGNNALTGNLPHDWYNLSKLEVIHLNNNQFYGQLPSSWSNLTNLRVLSVMSNQLTGSLPDEWSALQNLEELYIEVNNFNGSLPPTWSTLTKLKYLNAARNQLSGLLPVTWSNLESILGLILDNNQFKGSFPSSWSELTSLVQLNIQFNQLTGSIPESWSQMQSLIHLNIKYNNLDGLPDISEFENLNELIIEGNKFDFGDIEPIIEHSSLEYFTYVPQQNIGETKTHVLDQGQEFRIGVSVGGSNNIYQWYKNDVLIPNENEANFVISSVVSGDVGAYNCKISNSIVGNLVLESYPEILEVNTLGLPIVSTTEPYYITASTAESGGIVIEDGESAVTSRGVCWSKEPNPTIDNDKTINGSGLGTFFSSIDGLERETKYFIRAYATNDNGTSYGFEYSFRTNQIDQPDLVIIEPEVYPNQVSSVGRFDLSCGYYNQGTKSDDPSFLKAYLSEDEWLDQDDHLLFEALMLQPDYLQYYGVYSLSLPEGTPNGVYKILFVADADDNVVESNEFNNLAIINLYVGTLGIERLEDPSDFIVYPNPSSGDITITVPKDANLIQAWDMSGKMVKQIEDIGFSNKVTLSFSEGGIHFVRVHVKGKILIQRVIILN